MRFYDPEFGTVLIDGVDVKKYKIADLRQRMGLVMQEPVLFNYSVKENVLYGHNKASNQMIKDAVSVANAKNFVESDSLEHRITDDAASLVRNMESSEYREALIAELGQEQFDENLQILKTLEARQIADGTFEEIKDLIDQRDDQMKGDCKLHGGYDIQCGIRGNKLSGG